MSLNYTTADSNTGRTIGSSGKIYLMDFEKNATNNGNIEIGTWFQVKAKKAQASVLSDLEIGQIVRAGKQLALSGGDEVLEFTPVESGVAQGITGDLTKEKYDVTTQTDTTTTYEMSRIVEGSGSMDIVLQTSDPLYLDMNKEFSQAVEVAADGTMSNSDIQNKVFHLLISHDEHANPEIWRYAPIKVSKLPINKPLKGEVILSIEYSLDGKSNPHTIVIHKA